MKNDDVIKCSKLLSTLWTLDEPQKFAGYLIKSTADYTLIEKIVNELTTKVKTPGVLKFTEFSDCLARHFKYHHEPEKITVRAEQVECAVCDNKFYTTFRKTCSDKCHAKYIDYWFFQYGEILKSCKR